MFCIILHYIISLFPLAFYYIKYFNILDYMVLHNAIELHGIKIYYITV